MIFHRASAGLAGLVTVILFLGNGQAVGQEFELSALEEVRSQLRAETREIVRQELRLTASEAEAFWPVYDKFRADIKRVRDRQVALISDYMRAYRADELTDRFAERILNDHLSIEKDLLNVKRKYVRRFRKALPTKKVTLFYQLENNFDAAFAIQLAEAIPLFDDLEIDNSR
jgi:hypothetical protein